MSAVIGAFVQYILTFIYFIIIAGLGIFAGKKLHKRKIEKAEQGGSEKE